MAERPDGRDTEREGTEMKAGVSIFWVVILAACLVLPGIVGCSESSSQTDPISQNPPGDNQDDTPMGAGNGKAPADRGLVPGEEPELG